MKASAEESGIHAIANAFLKNISKTIHLPIDLKAFNQI